MGEGSGVAVSCGVGRRRSSDPYAMGVALKSKNEIMYVFIYCLFAFSRAAPAAYGGSQARSRIRAVTAGLHHSHSNAGSEPHLQPTPQLTATLDRQPTEQGQGSNPQPHGS